MPIQRCIAPRISSIRLLRGESNRRSISSSSPAWCASASSTVWLSSQMTPSVRVGGSGIGKNSSAMPLSRIGWTPRQRWLAVDERRTTSFW
jgi:hypothetical protein